MYKRFNRTDFHYKLGETMSLIEFKKTYAHLLRDIDVEGVYKQLGGKTAKKSSKKKEEIEENDD